MAYSETCKICNQENVNKGHFYKEHRISEAEYFLSYYPKASLLTGKQITFKNYDNYIDSDFEDLNEFKKWLTDNPDKAESYIIGRLKKRKEKKSLVRSLGQVEMKSAKFPSILWMEKKFGKSYDQINLEAKLFNKFPIRESVVKFPSLVNGKILIDTREQTPCQYKTIKSERATLKFGDYAISAPYHDGVVIERKSIADFAHSFGVDCDRLDREIKRCQDANSYLVVVVESVLSKALSFNYLPQMKWSKVSPDFVFRNVRDLMVKYSNIQFVFVEKKEFEKVSLNIFKMGSNVRNIDLELLYEEGKL